MGIQMGRATEGPERRNGPSWRYSLMESWNGSRPGSCNILVWLKLMMHPFAHLARVPARRNASTSSTQVRMGLHISKRPRASKEYEGDRKTSPSSHARHH